MLGARIFVSVVFLVLGASFLASSAVLIYEFKEGDWIALVVAHSNLFFFFPVLGVLALIAFFLPSVIFTHLYFNHIRFGRARFLFGFLVVVLATGAVDRYLDASPRAIWELSPSAIARDRGEPGDCQKGQCRAAIGEVLATLRKEAQKRVGLSKFARGCSVDEYLEERPDMKLLRYCFPAGTMLDGRTCCKAQHKFSAAVDRLQADPAQRSLTGKLDRIFMPLKIFFVLVVIAIGFMLALWRDRVDLHYAKHVPAMERGVIIGAFAMLFWPAMDYGYLTTANVLFGHVEPGLQFRLSLVIAPWVLLLLFYFLRRLGQQGEMIGQFSGVAAAAVAVLRYEQINDWATRLLGIGMPMWVMAALFAFTAAGLVSLFWPWAIPAPPEKARS